jgi:transcriptional regulator with XRE-family HTH domain
MDIQLIVNEILETGLTQTDVATRVKCSQATISDLARGLQTTTKIDIGLRILELHAEVVKSSKKRRLSDRSKTRKKCEIK